MNNNFNGLLLIETNSSIDFYEDKDALISDIEAIDAMSGYFRVFDFNGNEFKFIIGKKVFRLFWRFISNMDKKDVNIFWDLVRSYVNNFPDVKLDYDRLKIFRNIFSKNKPEI